MTEDELKLLQEEKSALEEKVAAISMTTPAQVQAVSIKPPNFSEANPARFFTVLEAQFHLKAITQSKTKFFHALTALPEETLNAVSDTTVTGENYEDLKNFVITYYEKSRPELFEKLISNTPLTGKPSHNLRQLENIANKVGVIGDILEA